MRYPDMLYNFPVVRAATAVKIAERLGVRPWQPLDPAKPDTPLEEYIAEHPEAGARLKTDAPKVVVAPVLTPAGATMTAIRCLGTLYTTSLILVDGTYVLVVAEYAFGAKKVIFRPPCGVPKGKEPPAETARREVMEEIGLRLPHIRRLLTHPVLVLSSRHDVHCLPYLAEITNPSSMRRPRPDKNEIVGSVLFPLREWLKMLRNSSHVDEAGHIATAAAWLNGYLSM